MATQPRTLVTREQAENPGNGWEKLLPLLDPTIANAPRTQELWKKLQPRMIFYLINTVRSFPWLNHLALAGAIYTESGAAQPFNPVRSVHPFLRWAIPEHYHDVSSLKPVEALFTYFGDPPQPRGEEAARGYNSLQLHMQLYLQSLPPEERTKLSPFLLPILINTPRLSQFREAVAYKAQTKRKEQAFAVTKELHALIVMGRQRYQWLADLEAQVQQISELAHHQQITFPALIQCPDLDHRQDLTFRVWDRVSWIKAHPNAYNKNALNKQVPEGRLLLQLVGTLPDNPWFLRAVEMGALKAPCTLNAQARQYLRDCNIPPFKTQAGLILASNTSVNFIKHARRIAASTPADSHILFFVEPLLAGAAVGLFALVCLTQSGMRIGELQQVSGDKACMKIGLFPRFDEKSDGFTAQSTPLFFWLLYPKGSRERQPYAVTPFMQEALKVWIELHDRVCGRFQEVRGSRNNFGHARRFPGKHLFVLQWKGQHLATASIEACLDLLLLEHRCLDSQGKPIRITAHVLRHGVAGYLRQQGVPLPDIAALLHQVNLMITDYYSKPSPQDLFAQVGPFLTRLGDVAEIDPATLRTVGDIQRLGQEALKRFGILRRIPGGTCAVFTACDVQFKCASCPAYIPDPTRRDEVREKIASCARTTQFLEQSGDLLQAEVQRAHGRHWERIEKEMQALAAIELTAPPFESALKEFGLDNLEEVDDEWLLTLKQQRPLLGEGGSSHA